MDAMYEPQREVHNARNSDEKAEIWKPSCEHIFRGGSQGGSEARPSAKLVL